MHRIDSDEIENMASGIINAISKFGIPVNQLADEQVWEELQKNGYKFPVGARSWDMAYKTDIIDAEVDS